MTSPLSTVIAALMANGYHPLPIAPDSKAPSEFRGGKWRPMTGWQKFRHEQPKDFLVKVWSNWPDGNVGVVTGTSATPQHILVVIDFDTDDYDILQELEAALPYSPVRKKGRRGHSSFYLAPVGTKGFRTPIVELLTDTRQTVIPPSIHPDTGKPYIWTTASTLLNTPAKDLPVLNEDDLERFMDTVEALTKKPVKPVETPFQPVEPGDDKFWRLLNNTAYANLDMWVPDLGLPKCRREGNGHYKAVAWWRPSSTGRDLSQRSPNLSIAPNLGARDFGTGDRYTAINLVMQALSVDLDDAVRWLGTRVNLIQEVKFQVPPIRMEQEGPAENSAPAEEPVNSTTEDAQTIEENEQAPEEPAEEEPAENSEEYAPEPPRAAPQTEAMLREFPTHLLNPQGLVGDIMDWIVGGARRPSRLLALGAALTIVGTLMGAGVRGPTRSASHLYVVALAPSGAGKDHPLQAIGKLLKASTCGYLVGPSEFMSMSSIINYLQRQALSVCGMDEFGAFLRKLNSKNASTHEQGISKILRSIWGISFGDYMTPEWAGRASVEIQRPAMSIYGVSTAEEYFESLQSADIRNGFLNRFLVFSTNIKPAEVEPQHDGEVPQELALKIVHAFNSAMALDPAQKDLPLNAPRILKDMVWNGGRPVYQDMVKKVEEISQDKHMEPFFARTSEIAVRIASIVAWGCGRMEVIREDMEWGRDVALWSAQNMAASAIDYMAENEHQKMYNRIIRMVENAASGGLTRRDLLQRLRGAVKAKELEDMLKMALESGDIEQKKSIPRKGGHPLIIYKRAKKSG
jgi:hypothetical protein